MDDIKRRPLAVRARPKSLEHVAGQKHILGEGKILRRIIESGNIPNMVFFGPSGTGKTTVANIIADQSKKRLFKLNGTNSGLADIKEIASQIDSLLAPNGILLYLDEIQYFNKKQQQSLLEYIENGDITMIAATTENPYFHIYNAVLSRCTVFEFLPLDADDIFEALDRVIDTASQMLGFGIEITQKQKQVIAAGTGGDMRKAINILEALLTGGKPKDGVIYVLDEDMEQLLGKASMKYTDDERFDLLSAFHKSLRGSDADASLHYLARLIEAGDLISICRRLLCAASEDVGLAYPILPSIIKNLTDSAMQLGFPEARLPLANAALLIAASPKSNSVMAGIDGALGDIVAGKAFDVPLHLKDAHYSGAKKLGRGIEYKYPHSFENNYIEQEYLPKELLGKKYYNPGNNKNERLTEEYWKNIRKQKK